MKRDLSKRESRVIARGELHGHSHIVTGECEIEQNGNDVIVHAGKNCAIKHLMEKPFIEEEVEVWTKEHTEIQLAEGESFKYIQQQEYNPYEKAIQQVRD